MDAQRKKGILDVCVLAVLKKGPSYGYLIIRDISRCIDISESTLYPILKRLEQNGSLRTYCREYNGRTRKYYELTETGQHRIDVFLEEWDELQRMYHFIEEENRREAESVCRSKGSEGCASENVPDYDSSGDDSHVNNVEYDSEDKSENATSPEKCEEEM